MSLFQCWYVFILVYSLPPVGKCWWLGLHSGFPVLQYIRKPKQTNQGGFNLGGINATGQVPKIPGNYGLIDKDTPLDVYTKKSYMHPDQELVLVFSDEFNEEGRTFYPGQDPYWEAVDLHYWGTVSCNCHYLSGRSRNWLLVVEWFGVVRSPARSGLSTCFVGSRGIEGCLKQQLKVVPYVWGYRRSILWTIIIWHIVLAWWVFLSKHDWSMKLILPFSRFSLGMYHDHIRTAGC